MSELKVGDGVAVYFGTGVERSVGTVLSIEGNRIKVRIVLSWGATDDAFVHRRQVGKLVKKPKEIYWVRICKSDSNHNYIGEAGWHFSDYQDCPDCRRLKLREVK